MWVMDEHHVPDMSDRWNQCLDMIMGAIHALLYMKQPTIPNPYNALVVGL
jgi:hypothetical protein